MPRLTKQDREVAIINKQRRTLRRLWNPEARLEYAHGGWFDVIETPGTHRVGKQIRSTEVEKLANAGYLTRVPHPSIAWVFELPPSGRSFVDPLGLLDQKLASRQRPSR